MSAPPIVIYSEDYLKLDFGPWHPFQPIRFIKTMENIENYLNFRLVTPKTIDPNLLVSLNIHSEHYIEKVKKCSELKIPYLSQYTTDTPCFKNLMQWALLYCGGAIVGCESLIRDTGNIAFNIAGGFHHAKNDDDGGFCIFNDCALALMYLWKNAKKPIYIDIDAHAGDGTYLILYDKPIPKISIHEDPRFLYPGRGFIHEVGVGEGYGYTLNIPLPPNSGDMDILSVFEAIITPILESYSPDIIVLQSGVDGYFRDPLTHLNYTHKAYISIAKILREQKIPILICPGGGYSDIAPILHTIIIAYLSYQESNIDRIVQTLEETTPQDLFKIYNTETAKIIQRIKKSHPLFNILGI